MVQLTIRLYKKKISFKEYVDHNLSRSKLLIKFKINQFLVKILELLNMNLNKDQQIRLSLSAIKRIQAMTAEGEFKGMFFRVAVAGGGCSGFQYNFSFENEKKSDDRLIQRDGVTVVIDKTSWDYLEGSELHYAEELVGSFFTMRNPNASSTCGCGVSFSIG